MTEETATEHQAMPDIIWQNVPTVLVEQVMGHASASGLHRFSFAEIVFNPSPVAVGPAFRQNINIAIPHAALPDVIATLQRAYDTAQEAPEREAPNGGE